jgi:non-specific serine/threonine protein kinase
MMQLLTVEAINLDNQLRSAAPQEMKKGRALYLGKEVLVDHVDARSARLTVAEAPGSQALCRVAIGLNGNQVTSSCTCNHAYPWTLCRHRVAGLLELVEYLTDHPPSIWKAVLSQAAQAPTRKTSSGPQKIIVFSLQAHGGSWRVTPYALLAKYFSDEALGDRKAFAAIVESELLGAQATPIRSRPNPQTYRAASADDVAAATLALGGNSYEYSYGYSYAPSISEALLAFLPHCFVFYGTLNDPLKKLIDVPADPARLALAVEETADGLRVATTLLLGERRIKLSPRKIKTVVRNPLWLLIDTTTLVQVEDAAAVQTLVEHPQLIIPRDERDEFFDNYLVPLADALPLSGPAIRWEQVEAEPTPRLYLSEAAGDMQAALRFAYGAYELPYEKTPPDTVTKRAATSDATLARIQRRPEDEQQAYSALSSFGLKRGLEPGSFLLRKGVDTVDFLLQHVPKLTANGYEIFGEENLTTAKVNRNKPTISFNVSSGIDWFDLNGVVNFGEIAVALKDIRRAVRKKERYIKLADGSIGAIPPEWVERYRHLFALGDDVGDGLRLGNHHLTLIDQLLGEADRVAADAQFEERRQKLRSFETIAARPLPPGFVGELRSYQKAGYDWLHFLHEYGFGGCLADDMGTGKTIQTLAFLWSLRASGHAHHADLLVVPRSLIFNWQREAQRFTPELKIQVHADQTRVRDTAAFAGADLILTTYGVMRRDIEVLREYPFHYIVLDESQAIKNPAGETSKAARLLKGEHRLCLTGTPVENSTSELWSQFAFLNPGLLGNLDYFREEFVTPIERKKNPDAATFLRKLVYPFILRRTKEQVAKDLPPRTERVLMAEMEPPQRALYVQQRDLYRAKLLGLIEDEGMGNARMQILEGLLRLRQLSNHPRLVDQEYDGPSAKFELLWETLDTLRAEGHKALVFSQFVQMLSLVREELDAQGIPYAYLDGQTRDREAVVERFQTDPSLPFFLISLKAGGVGLNLTAADYVIHIDPWWNPAAEQQASDRSHRIGQDKPVFVYKLVLRDTVEEKILQLQEHKRALVDQLISPEGGVFKSLTREDVEALFT